MEEIKYYYKNSEVVVYKKLICPENNSWSEKTYDEAGNELTHKNSDGGWCERTYDKRGKELTYKNNTGAWYERTYDKEGNELTYKHSNNYWYEKTYDGNGNLLTYKDSKGYFSIKGKEVTKEEFENFQNKPCLGKTVVIDGIEYTLS